MLAVALPLADLSVTIDPARTPKLLFSLLAAALPWLLRRDPAWSNGRAARAVQAIGLIGCCCLLGAVSSYLFARLGTGWADDALIALGGPLEGYWPAYWRLFHLNPVFKVPLGYAYDLIFPMPAILIAVLAHQRRQRRADRLVLAFAFALIATNILSFLFPATSAAVAFLTPGDPLMPPPGILHIAVIEGLRSGAISTIDLGAMIGLIAFPSFHASAAVIFAWGGWATGRLRYVFLGSNGLMLMATPTIGGHFLIECVAGVVIAVAAIAATRLFACEADRGVNGQETDRSLAVPTHRPLPL